MGRSPDRTYDNTTAANVDPATTEWIYLDEYRRYLVDYVPILGYCTVFTGVVGTPTVPIANDGAGIAAKAEATPLTDSEVGSYVLSQEQFKAKAILGQVDLTRLALAQSEPGFMDFSIRDTVDRQFAAHIRRGIIFGGGADDVGGIHSNVGITKVTPIANLSGMDYTDVANMWIPIRNANIEITPENGLLVCDPKVYAKLLTTSTSTGGDGMIVMGNRLQGLGFDVLHTSSDNPTTATTTTGYAQMGMYSECAVAFWTGTDLVIDIYTDISMVKYKFYRYWDVKVLRPKAFSEQVPAAL